MKFLILLFLTGINFACTTSNIKESMDTFTGKVSKKLYIRIDNPENATVLNLYLTRVEGSDSVEPRVFVNPRSFNFKSGKSLAFKSGDNTVWVSRANDSQQPRESIYNGHAFGSEVDYKPISVKKLKKIANSKPIMVHVKGISFNVNGTFSSEDSQLLRELLGLPTSDK